MTLSQNEEPMQDLDHSWREQLSALVDGECRPDELGVLLRAGARQAAVNAAWSDYHALGAALRGAADSPALPARGDFVAGVMARLASEPQPVLQPPAPVRAAANDERFRWKLVAGVAALAVLASVAWQLVSGPGAAGPQLAQTAPAAVQPVQTAEADESAAGTAVLTDRGVMLRDPEIEAMLAEHRQHGGMSALQAPAGFLRNVTFEPSAR